MNDVVVLIPIYKDELDEIERYSIDHSSAVIQGRSIIFIGPRNINRNFYLTHYPNIPHIEFDDDCFASIPGYNRLLMSADFYQRFIAYKFVLILQTDAIVLRDELDHWCALPFDYVGAPWPEGVELLVNLGCFEGDKGRKVRAMVGNGGFSLRRVRKCISLLQEFPEAVDVFNRSGSSEDLFFSFMGNLSRDFVLPNEIAASLFSLELKPSYYFSVNGGRPPMGGHAWWKYEPEFWRSMLPDIPATIFPA